MVENGNVTGYGYHERVHRDFKKSSKHTERGGGGGPRGVGRKKLLRGHIARFVSKFPQRSDRLEEGDAEMRRREEGEVATEVSNGH